MQIVPAIILHGFDQHIEGLVGPIDFTRACYQCIRFINEQHTTERRFTALVHFQCGLADRSRPRGPSNDLDQLPLFEHSQRPENAGRETRNGGFAGAGIAGEHHVQ